MSSVAWSFKRFSRLRDFKTIFCTNIAYMSAGADMGPDTVFP